MISHIRGRYDCICLSRVPTSTFSLTSCVAFKCILNVVLLTTFPDQLSYRKHSRMKKFIFLVFPLFPLLTRFFHALPFSCLRPMAFAIYPSLLKKKLGKVVTKLNTTYLNLRLTSLSILLIVLCNPSILNPGPTKLEVNPFSAHRISDQKVRTVMVRAVVRVRVRVWVRVRVRIRLGDAVVRNAVGRKVGN